VLHVLHSTKLHFFIKMSQHWDGVGDSIFTNRAEMAPRHSQAHTPASIQYGQSVLFAPVSTRESGEATPPAQASDSGKESDAEECDRQDMLATDVAQAHDIPMTIPQQLKILHDPAGAPYRYETSPFQTET
jgi:hypothetical protein